MLAACHQTFTGIHQTIKAKARHWSARGLSFLGRVHVAKQVLAASLWYHATFQQPPKQLLQQISRQLSQYVASAQHHSHSDVLLALAFLACGGHHILLRLLSLHLCNEYLSLPKKKKKKKKKNSHSDAALALAQGNSQDSAALVHP